MNVDITAVPSRFAWRTSPQKRPPPCARFSPKKGKHRLEESFTEESFTVSSDITSEADDTVSLETAEISVANKRREELFKGTCHRNQTSKEIKPTQR